MKGNQQVFEEDDDDPVLTHLRFLNYRYIQFCFNPLLDKFVTYGDWQDPSWTSVKSIRAGLDGEERVRRGKVFGKNQLDVQQKSLVALLVDEVSQGFICHRALVSHVPGPSPVLCLSGCQSHTLVTR